MERVIRGEALDRDPHVTNTIVKSDDIRDKRGKKHAPPVSAPASTPASEPRY